MDINTINSYLIHSDMLDPELAKTLESRKSDFLYVPKDGKAMYFLLDDGRVLVMLGANFNRMTGAECNDYFRRSLARFM
jgi:hypothetical protein